MEKMIVLLVMAGTALFVAPLIGVLFGAFGGWVVGLFMAEPILGFLARIGVDVAGLEMWQIGAALGFIGGFFRGSSVTRKES